jgi:hypothetical protein
MIFLTGSEGAKCVETEKDVITSSTFWPMRKQVEAWQRSELTDVTDKMVI